METNQSNIPKHRSTFADHPDVKDILPIFLARLPTHVKNLRAKLAAGDREGLLALCHQLRGAGKSFGFAEISEYAGQIEETLHAGATAEACAPQVQNLVAFMENVDGFGGASP